MDSTVGLGPLADSDPIGQRIEGFQVLSLLGAGGMGRVYKALDLRLKREVALKMLAPLAAGDRELRARFAREVQALSALSHPNVAQIHTSGFFQGCPFYVMEYVDGSSLAALLDEAGHLSGRRCLGYLIDAAKGLEAARDKGIIHRDIKPGNLMLDESGRLKIVDFGLARSLIDDIALTRSDRVLGTPLYIAPEQAKGEPLDHRADIYSLGASFYHLLTGEPPFQRDTPLALVLRHVNEPLTPVRSRNPRVPATVAAIIEKMLAKEPADRYPTYAALIADLERAKSGLTPEAISSASGPRLPTRPRSGSVARRRPPERRLVLALACGGAVAGLVLAGLLVRRLPGLVSEEIGRAAQLASRPEDLPAVAPGDARARPASQARGGRGAPEPGEGQPFAEDGPGSDTAADSDTASGPDDDPIADAGADAEDAFESDPDPDTDQPSGSDTDSGGEPGRLPRKPPRGPRRPGSAETPPPTFQPAELIERAYRVSTMGNMRRLSVAVEASLAESGELPATLEDLAASLELHPRGRLDGWRREIRYEPGEGTHYRLLSAGPDGAFDSEDDLVFEDGYFLDEAGAALP